MQVVLRFPFLDVLSLCDVRRRASGGTRSFGKLVTVLWAEGDRSVGGFVYGIIGLCIF
jgi:hypothetical protein